MEGMEEEERSNPSSPIIQAVTVNKLLNLSEPQSLLEVSNHRRCSEGTKFQQGDCIRWVFHTKSPQVPPLSCCFVFLFFLAVPHSMWDLSSLTRGQTRAPLHRTWRVLTTGPPRKSFSQFCWIYLGQRIRSSEEEERNRNGMYIRDGLGMSVLHPSPMIAQESRCLLFLIWGWFLSKQPLCKPQCLSWLFVSPTEGTLQH